MDDPERDSQAYLHIHSVLARRLLETSR